MGTIVTIDVIDLPDPATDETGDPIERAFEWFREVERHCNRFDAGSELRQLSGRQGAPVRASEILYAAVEFALALAEETDGAFDPTVGLEMEGRGFNRDYRSGAIVRTALPLDASVTYLDVALNPAVRTITLRKPLLLDLGAVAKGLAIDLAARELAPLENYAIDAGGDLYVAGHNASGKPWSIGIRHPREDRRIIERLDLSNTAICTSGDYERREAGSGGHILDPRRGDMASSLASATVIASTAMLADGLATAAFVLGPVAGLELIDRHGAGGLLLTPSLERFATRGLSAAILPNA